MASRPGTTRALLHRLAGGEHGASRGKNAQDLKLGNDVIGKRCCANFAGASLLAAEQPKEKDLSAGGDGLVSKAMKTGNFSQSRSL